MYAENGRGKSTISAVIASLGSGDVTPLVARHTFGGGNQKIKLRYKVGEAYKNIDFDGAKWSETASEVIVFDQHFVERNVYAGSEVQTTHHEALLEFALGTAAVKKKQEVEESGEKQILATRRRTAAEEKLKGYMGTMTYNVFFNIKKDERIDETIKRIEDRIAAAKNANTIATRASLSYLAAPRLDFTSLKTILSKSLQDIHVEAPNPL